VAPKVVAGGWIDVAAPAWFGCAFACVGVSGVVDAAGASISAVAELLASVLWPAFLV